jgi:hypothetical protein
MISVKIEINRTPIIVVHAVRLKGTPGTLCEYEVFTESNMEYNILGYISHHYDDGAEELSKKMIDLYLKKKGETV